MTESATMELESHRERAEAANRAQGQAIEARDALRQRLRNLESELATFASERRTLAVKLAQGEDGCVAALDACEKRQREISRESEGVSTLLADADQLVASADKLREQATQVWQRARMVAGFEAAKQDTLKAFADLKTAYGDACHALATFAAGLDEMDAIGAHLDDPNFARIRQALQIETLDYPNATLPFLLRRAGFAEKLSGWGPGWRILVQPLFRPRSQKGNS